MIPTATGISKFLKVKEQVGDRTRPVECSAHNAREHAWPSMSEKLNSLSQPMTSAHCMSQTLSKPPTTQSLSSDLKPQAGSAASYSLNCQFTGEGVRLAKRKSHRGVKWSHVSPLCPYSKRSGITARLLSHFLTPASQEFMFSKCAALLRWKLFLILPIPFLDFKTAVFVVLFNQDLFQLAAAMFDSQQSTKQIIQTIRSAGGRCVPVQRCCAKPLPCRGRSRERKPLTRLNPYLQCFRTIKYI